jgi:hypothetical protein
MASFPTVMMAMLLDSSQLHMTIMPEASEEESKDADA